MTAYSAQAKVQAYMARPHQASIPYDTQVYPDAPMDSCFSLLLEDFSEGDGWRQVL